MTRYFFAIADNLLPVYSCIEAKRQVVYTPMGLFKSPPSQVFKKGQELPRLLPGAGHSWDTVMLGNAGTGETEEDRRAQASEANEVVTRWQRPLYRFYAIKPVD